MHSSSQKLFLPNQFIPGPKHSKCQGKSPSKIIFYFRHHLAPGREPRGGQRDELHDDRPQRRPVRGGGVHAPHDLRGLQQGGHLKLLDQG